MGNGVTCGKIVRSINGCSVHFFVSPNDNGIMKSHKSLVTICRIKIHFSPQLNKLLPMLPLSILEVLWYFGLPNFPTGCAGISWGIPSGDQRTQRRAIMPDLGPLCWMALWVWAPLRLRGYTFKCFQTLTSYDYRVTIHLSANLPLTPKQRLRFRT